MSAASEIRKIVPGYREGKPLKGRVRYLCGCSYESDKDAYHDRHCAECHRLAWERYNEPAPSITDPL